MTTTTTWTTALLVSAAAAAADPQAMLTEARVAADAGRIPEAVRLFQAVAADEDAPMAVRCEALVREAAAEAPRDPGRSNALFAQAGASQCAREAEAMRLLVEAVTGVEQDPLTWRGREEPVRVDVSDGRVKVWLGDDALATSEAPSGGSDAPAATAKLPEGGEPISLSMKDAEVGDVFRLFSQFTGVAFRVEPPEAAKRTITLELVDVPWEQAVALVLGTNGLRAEQDALGVRVFPNTFSELRGDEALLNTVRLAFFAYATSSPLPDVPTWTPVARHASLVEPAFVRTLPRVTSAGRPIEMRVEAGALELRVRPE